MTVAITRTELDAAGLRAAASRCKDAAAARRMLALALVMEGTVGAKRHALQAWIGRRCAIGCIGITRAGLRVCTTHPSAAGHRAS